MPTATASISVEDAVNRRRGDLVELSHSIHAEPELAFAEHRSCAKTQALVADYGFEITAAPGGLDTAFRADYGSGPLVVGICAEYDALPGHRTCLRPQHHRRLRRRHGAGIGGGRRRTGPDGRADRHPRRGGRRRKSVAAQGRNVRRHRGHGDAAPRAARHRAQHAHWRCRRSRSATRAGRRMPPSRRIWASTPPTRSPSRRSPSACCVSSWCPARWCTASSPTAARPRTSYPPAPRCTTRCVPTTPRRCASSKDRMADCFLAGAVATGCDYRVRETEPAVRRAGARPVAGRHLPCRDGAAGPQPRSPRTWRRRCRWAAPIWATSPR